MSFKKIDETTSVAERELKGALDQAQRGPAPSTTTESIEEEMARQAQRIAVHQKSIRGELPRTR